MLKQLIQWLLDSRTTPAQAAHSALRNTSSSTSIFTGEQIYTAPEDGFITVEGKSEANGGSAIGISSNGENHFLRTFQSVKDWGQAVTAPVSKGETVSISLYTLTDIAVKFSKSFGGGYKLLVRRALSCLKPSFNYLPRSSLRANPNGSAVRHTLQGGLRSQPASPNMSLQRMGMLGSTKIKRPRAIASTFILTGLMGTSSQEKLWHSRITLMPLLSRASFLLRRATGLLFPVRSMRYGSRQRWEANSNLSTGGALC